MGKREGCFSELKTQCHGSSVGLRGLEPHQTCLSALLEPTPHHGYLSAFCGGLVNKGVFSKSPAVGASLQPSWCPGEGSSSALLGAETLAQLIYPCAQSWGFLPSSVGDGAQQGAEVIVPWQKPSGCTACRLCPQVP